MVLKMTNKDKIFYNYMGRFFGSRIVQNETKDRVYDDNGKVWYVYVDDNEKKAYAFVSVCDGVIKNVYAKYEEHLTAILKKVTRDIKIQPSIVTNIYADIYKKCGLIIDETASYKNFTTVRSEK